MICASELGFVLVLVMALALSARGQSPLDAHDADLANQLFDHGSEGGRLACTFIQWRPFLDFSFRYDVTYAARCRISQFRGMKRGAHILARVTPKGGAPVLLGQLCKLPAIAPRIDLGSGEVECGGGFWVSAGKYQVEILMLDERGRTYRMQWNVSTSPVHNPRGGPPPMPAHTVQAWDIPSWDGELHSRGTGIRMTVLLDVASVSPKVFKLRSWDREFLMQSLATLLQQTPCSAVRLIAFNLDQQREIFRQDHFDKAGFQKLWQALEDIELGSIAAHTVQDRPGWLDFLAGLSNEEVTAQEPSDVVAFIGPAIFLTRKVPEEILKPRQTSKPQFFYFQHMPYAFYNTPERPGSEFADSIQYLTKAREGTVFKIHSPAELAQAVQKMLRQSQAGVQKPSSGS